MPTKKEKQRLKEVKRTEAHNQDAAARKAGLAATRAKLAAGAKASSEAGESVQSVMPSMSVRLRKALKNRTKL